MLMSDFFWGWKSDRKRYHWASWKNLSFPYDGGGVGMRNLKDICKAFQFKQWWIFRTKQTLWGDFLRGKYCKRSNNVSKKWDTGESLTWKYMLLNRQQVEQHIEWKLQPENCSFLWDNLLGNGPSTQFTTNINKFNNSTVTDFWEEGRWSWSKLLEQGSGSQVSNI